MKTEKISFFDKYSGENIEYERFDYEDFVVDKGLCSQLDWLQVFDNNGKRYQHPLLDYLFDSQVDFKKHTDASSDSNLYVVFRWMQLCEVFEPEWKYKNAFINWTRLNCILFLENPYWRSRFGHLLWWAVNYANPDSYYILKWEYLYDPRSWYKPGEPRRIEDRPPVPEGGSTPATS